MNIVVLLVPMALLLAFGFVGAFVWAAHKGQYDDLETPAQKILIDDKVERKHL